MTRDTLAEAAVELRQECADRLLRDAVAAFLLSQESRETFDWLRAGSACLRYTDAAVAAGSPTSSPAIVLIRLLEAIQVALLSSGEPVT